MEGMENDMVRRIRDALHPFTFCAFPGEVYSRRNDILKELVQSRAWASSQDKYEVISLIIRYWGHGSHPPRNALRPLVPITEPQGDVEHVDQHIDAGDVAALSAIFEDLCVRVPDVSENDCEDHDVEMCHSCNRNPMCEWTPPECEACYNEHCP